MMEAVVSRLLRKALSVESSTDITGATFAVPHVSVAAASDLRSSFTIDDLDRLLTVSGLRPPFLSIWSPHEIYGSGYSKSLEVALGCGSSGFVLRQLLAAKATIIVQHAHLIHPVIRSLVAGVEARLHPMSVQCNIYLTPANASGVPPHVDPHHTLLLQLSGSKRWRVFKAGTSAPSQITDVSAPLLDTRVCAGDAILIPRGFVHCATTGKEHSLHLTLGISDPSAPVAVEIICRDRLADASARNLKLDAHDSWRTQLRGTSTRLAPPTEVL